MKRFIPYGRQDIQEDDIQEVIKILQSDWLTQGPTIDAFEESVATYCNANYASAVSNATAALHLACRAFDLGPQDTIWTSPNTFVASSNCALYCNANVDFIDIDPRTYNISATSFAEKLQEAKKTNRLPKLLIVVHFAGQSCEMAQIKALADEYNIKIVEDASHAIGGKYLDHMVGSCQFSDAAIFSFHPVKIITTAEGGMLLTNSKTIKEKMDLLRSHGITRNPEKMQEETHGAWYYQQVDLGFNYRMTDIQAGLGLSQLGRINTFIEKRHALAKRYNQSLAALPLIVPWQHPDCHSAYHLYPIQLKLDEISLSRKEVFDALRAAGIGVNVHYIPVHTQPYYSRLGFKKGDFPQAEKYYERAISIPMYSSMQEQDQDFVIDTLHEILR